MDIISIGGFEAEIKPRAWRQNSQFRHELIAVHLYDPERFVHFGYDSLSVFHLNEYHIKALAELHNVSVEIINLAVRFTE
jgi:hypothetical protein